MRPSRLFPVIAAPAMALMISFPAVAAPLDSKHLPADAKWVLHVDIEAITQSALAERARQNRPGIVKKAQEWLQERYGINPREDLHSLTAFSDTYESHTGTMILKADYDQEKVASELKNQENVQTTSWENYTLYTVDKKGKSGGQADKHREKHGDQPAGKEARAGKEAHGGKSVTIVLIDGKSAVFASSPERAKAAVKLLKGESPSLKTDSPLLANLPKGAIAYGAAVDLTSIKQREGIFPVLQQHEQITWVFGEDSGECFDRLTLVAVSEEVAENMKTFFEGVIAFGEVWAADSESISKLVEDTEVTIDGKTVERHWRGDSEVLLDALGELSQRVQQRIAPMIR